MLRTDPDVSAGPSEGLVIASRYRLEAMIGEGGMARVWRAKDLTLARAVAVKFLFLREDRDRRTMLDRFLREARIAAAVRHPNVVDLLDFGTTEDGRPFMVMELLEGESLEDRLQRQPTLTLNELVAIASGTLEGLAAVHRAGIIHRDLKPDNVFLLDEGGEVRPKLLDFGVSRDTDPTSGRRSALTTNDGYLVGTPEYMSPEQARGLKDIDWRTDIYSVGVVLYEAMTGRLPYQSDAVGDLIIDIVAAGAPPVVSLRPEVGEELSEVVARAMRSDREERFQSAREMRDALAAAAEASLGVGVRPSLPMLVPARRLPSASGPRVAGDGGSLDGIDLAWGADAVPSLAAPPVPKHWSVETELPRAPSRSRLFWIAATAMIPAAGLGTWLALRDISEPTPAPAAAGPTVEVAPADPTRDPEPAPERAPSEPVAAQETEAPPEGEPAGQPSEAAEVRVMLLELPAGARVRVDDAPVEPSDGALMLPQDGAVHAIVVTAGRRIWRVSHRADADGTYHVRLRRPSRGREDEGEEPSSSGGVFRDLDY